MLDFPFLRRPPSRRPETSGLDLGMKSEGVRNIPSGNPEEYLCSRSCNFQTETEYPSAIGTLAPTAPAGLSVLQHRHLLAGNDPLLADLTLSLDLLDDAILVLHE